MPRRTRSILIDNTLGKIFTNIDTVTTDSSKLIAGTKLQATTISSGSKTNVVVAKNLGTGVGVPFVNPALLTTIKLSVSTAPAGQPIIVAVKGGSSYANSSVLTTVTLPVNTSTVTSSMSITIQSGQNIYLDVTQAGTTKPGTGLSVRLEYYTG
jgi:hypothetical protein